MKKIFCILLLIIVGITNKSCIFSCACGTPPSIIHSILLTDGTYFYLMDDLGHNIDTLVAALIINENDFDTLYRLKAPRNIDKVAISYIDYGRPHRNSVNRQVGDSVRIGVAESIVYYIKGEEDKTYRFMLEYEDEENNN